VDFEPRVVTRDARLPARHSIPKFETGGPWDDSLFLVGTGTAAVMRCSQVPSREPLFSSAVERHVFLSPGWRVVRGVKVSSALHGSCLAPLLSSEIGIELFNDALIQHYPHFVVLDGCDVRIVQV